MAAVRSIFEYVSNKCYNGLYDAAKKYLDNHWHTMGLETRRVAEIKNAELIDATVQRVYVTDRPGNCIAFDIGLELEVCVSSADHHNDSDDTCYPWLRFSCEGDLSKGLDDWEIREITPYAKRNIPDNSMSDALVPDIRPAQYEKTATDFLEEYYPEALRITKVGEPPIYVDPYVLADRLGLSVLTHRINKEGSLFGQLTYIEDNEQMTPIGVYLATLIFQSEFPKESETQKQMDDINRAIENQSLYQCIQEKAKKILDLSNPFEEQMYYDLMNMAKMRCCTPYVSPEDYDRMVRFTESAIADDKWDIINKFLQLGNRALSKQDMEKN